MRFSLGDEDVILVVRKTPMTTITIHIEASRYKTLSVSLSLDNHDVPVNVQSRSDSAQGEAQERCDIPLDGPCRKTSPVFLCISNMLSTEGRQSKRRKSHTIAYDHGWHAHAAAEILFVGGFNFCS
jgi:hypothetical protein